MARGRRPSVLFILADDLGYGDLSAFNGGLSSTPAIDALIREGVCFTQQYAASPVCNPSRACLLTGRYPHRTGSIDTLEWWGLERLSLRERTLAEMLQANGYATGLVGKWHLGAFDPRYHPLRRGFDETVCFRGGMHDYWQWRVEWGETARRTDGRYLTDVWTEEAVQFLERHRRESFFLHVTYNAPHTPLQAPEENLALFRDKPGLTRAVQTLYGMIHRMDAGIGRILETLERLGLRNNTIVIFTSDNGPQFGGQGEDCLDRFNCNFRGAKCHTYEGGIRVPLVLRWPDGLPERRQVHDMAHFADWLPTLLEMTGTALPDDNLPLDGFSLLPALRGEAGKTVTRRCWQWNRYEPVYECNVAIRDGDWKLVRPWLEGAGPDIVCGQWLWVSMYGPEHFLHNGIIPRPYPERALGPPRPPELYNLRDDPYEERDLAVKQPEVARRLQRIWRVGPRKSRRSGGRRRSTRRAYPLARYLRRGEGSGDSESGGTQMSFSFQEQGGHAAIVYDGQEILALDKMITYHGGPWWVSDQVMVPGGEPEVSHLPIFAFYGYHHAVSDVAYEATEREDSLTLKITPTGTITGTDVLEQVRETCTFTVRLEEGRFVWDQRLEIEMLQDLDTAQLYQQAALRVYRFPHQDGRPGIFYQFCDPQPVWASGPAVPMTHDWQWQFEPSVGPGAFRQHWQRRWVSLIFQNLDGSYSWSELNKTKWAHLTMDNRRARPCHPQGYLYLLKEGGEGLEYKCDATSHYHHVCEWGMDFHFWCDLAPFLQGTVLPAGTRLAAATTVRLVGPEVTGPILAAASKMELTEREFRQANLPAYEEPENSFTVSALERLDAQCWTPTSEGCRWETTGAHHGGGGCLVIHNQYSNVGTWEQSSLGPQQWGNPFLAGARYRLSAWVRVEDGDFDTQGGPDVGVEFMQSNGPAYVSSKEWVDCGWSRSLIRLDEPRPDLSGWRYVELITPPCPSFVIYGKLKLRLVGRGTAYFSNVRWEMV